MRPCDVKFPQTCSTPINKLQMMHQFATGSDWKKFVGGFTQWFEKQVLDEKFSLDQDVAINSNPVGFAIEAILPDGNSTKVRTFSLERLYSGSGAIGSQRSEPATMSGDSQNWQSRKTSAYQLRNSFAGSPGIEEETSGHQSVCLLPNRLKLYS
jgi:hypothetical protein